MLSNAFCRIGLPALLLLATTLPTTALAAVPTPDQDFIDAKTPLLREHVERLTPASRSTSGAIQALRELLGFHDEVLSELNEKHPLTTLDGIETQDQFEDIFVREITGLVENGVEAEGSAPTEDDVVYFSVVMGDPPPLGDSPVAFMVLEYAVLALATADALDADPSITKETAEKLTLRFTRQAFSLYEESHIDLLASSDADSFRQSAVIVRLRCPTDGSTYRVSGMKNKIYEGGQVSTIYSLKSNGTYEELAVEFPLRYLTRLTQISDKQQKQKKKPKPLKPNDLNP